MNSTVTEPDEETSTTLELYQTESSPHLAKQISPISTFGFFSVEDDAFFSPFELLF